MGVRHYFQRQLVPGNENIKSHYKDCFRWWWEIRSMSNSHVDASIPAKLCLCFALVLAHHRSVLLPQLLTFAGKIALELLLTKCKKKKDCYEAPQVK
jgi:hypothetical protein